VAEPQLHTWGARSHARRASQLLVEVEATAQRLEKMSAEERVGLVATGTVQRVNRDLEWTVSLAHAHATTALALLGVEARA
jgi:hypothetical protein